MFLLAAAVGACLFGLGKSIAAADNSDAEEMNDEAESMVDDARRSVEAARLKSSKELELLGLEKVAAWQGPLSHFLKTINKLQNVDMDKIFLSVEGKKLSKETLAQMEVAYKEVEHAFGVGVGTLAAGAGAALVSYAAVGAFASAGTGDAIAGLSGAAATNATLAWLGGGALTAGGVALLPMAGAIVASMVASAVFTGLKNWAYKDAYAAEARAREIEARCAEVCRKLDAYRRQVESYFKASNVAFYRFMSDSLFMIDSEDFETSVRGANKVTKACGGKELVRTVSDVDELMSGCFKIGR